MKRLHFSAWLLCMIVIRNPWYCINICLFPNGSKRSLTDQMPIKFGRRRSSDSSSHRNVNKCAQIHVLHLSWLLNKCLVYLSVSQSVVIHIGFSQIQEKAEFHSEGLPFIPHLNLYSISCCRRCTSTPLPSTYARSGIKVMKGRL